MIWVVALYSFYFRIQLRSLSLSCFFGPRTHTQSHRHIHTHTQTHTHTHTHKYLEGKGRGMLSVFLVITELSVYFLIFNLEKTNILTFRVV